MNKKLLSLAVAAALTAPAAVMADATLYGKVHASLDYADVKNVVRPVYAFDRDANGDIIRDANGYPTLVETVPGEDYAGWGMSSSGYIPGEGRASRLGVKGSEDLGGGLKAIYQIELGINLNDTNNNVLSNSDSITYRNSFVGLAGGWGTALMGRHDTPMKISTGKLDLFADTMADYNGTVGFRDFRADNAVAYISPSFSGFTFAAAIVPSGGATGGGRGLNLEEDSIAGAYSLAGIYSNGPFYASVAYESLGSDHFNTQNTALNFSDCPYETPPADQRTPTDPFASACNYNEEDMTAWRIGLGLLDWNGFTLTGIYEAQDGGFTGTTTSDTFAAFTDPANPGNNWRIPGAPDEATLWQIQAGYRFGNMMIKGMYGAAQYEGDYQLGATYLSTGGGPVFQGNLERGFDYDIETWGVGFDYNFSKRTTAYVLYTDVSDDRTDLPAPSSASDWSGFSLGMMHSF
jgi:predicted porin